MHRAGFVAAVEAQQRRLVDDLLEVDLWVF
jgi:hypothetical protein